MSVHLAISSNKRIRTHVTRIRVYLNLKFKKVKHEIKIQLSVGNPNNSLHIKLKDLNKSIAFMLSPDRVHN